MIVSNSKTITKNVQTSKKPFSNTIDWSKLETIQDTSNPILIQTIKRQFNTPLELASTIIKEANKKRITVVCNNIYPEGLFSPVYFTPIEKSLGHTRDIKTYQLNKAIQYCFNILDNGANIEVWLIKKSVQPQIMTDPSSFLHRLKCL
jgi:hypothetical protein